MITRSGKSVFPGDGNCPTLYDIGWGLARTARFAGQTKTWYTVLPHVYTVAALTTTNEGRLHALLHDSAESIVGDQVTTWKNHLTQESEDEILDLLYLSLDIDPSRRNAQDMIAEVKAADLCALAAEAFILGHSDPDHPHFQEVRMAYSEMYNRAVDLTRIRVQIYTPEYCVVDTNARAKFFESEVTKAIANIEVTA